MELTKKLNLDHTPFNASLGDMSYAKNIVATLTEIINEPGFKHLSEDANKLIIGVIPIPDGYVLFCKGTNDYYQTDYIQVYKNNHTYAEKIIKSLYFKFNSDRPIFGEYTFNYNKELIVSFSEGIDDLANETRIINITTSPATLTQSEVEQLNLIPNVVYPKLKFDIVKSGSNKVGTYQVAIAYKLSDKTYSNYSLLHTAIHIIPDILEDAKPGIIISKSIKVTSSSSDSKYTECKLGIVYKEDTQELAYETEDININSLNGYIISNVHRLNSVALENIIINGISYIKDNAHTSFNSVLLRGAVTTPNYSNIDSIGNNIANNCQVKVEWIDIKNPFESDNSNIKYFREEEVYALYIGLLDYKGSLINSYPIKHKVTDDTLGFDNDNTHIIPVYNLNVIVNKPGALIKVILPSNINDLLGTKINTVKQVCIFYAQHNLNNSRVLTQAFVSRDSHINDISQNEYRCPFNSHTKLRLYSFDYLFTKQPLTDVNIKTQWKLGGCSPTHRDFYVDYTDTGEFQQSLRVFPDQKYNAKSETLIQNPAIDYIGNDNSIQNNVGGDSYYRTTLPFNVVNSILGGQASKADGSKWYDLPDTTSVNFWHNNGWGNGPYPADVDSPRISQYHTEDCSKYKFALVNIFSRAATLYDNLYNQTLVICSPIHVIGDNEILCTGDTFYNNFTFKMTTPIWKYEYGNPDAVKDTFINRIIISVNMESRFNMQGRFSGLNAYQKVFNIKDNAVSTESARKELFAINYKYDNFINTTTGLGYANSLHENGMAINYYIKELKGIDKLISRVIRSNVNNSESLSIGWRRYNANNYIDLPLQRGIIQVLLSTDKYVYIQQEHGLRVASVENQLDVKTTTFLGSSDIFDREPQEVLYDKQGYISCSNRFGVTITPFGYIIIDSQKAKIFIVNGIQATELTKDTAKDWFVYHVKSIGDNPFKAKGIHITYEDIHKRLLISYKDTDTDKGFTISYSLLRMGFIAFHDYIGDYSFYNNNGTYQIKDGSVFKMNHTNKAIYFDGLVKESIVQLIWNPQTDVSKLLQTIEWQTLINTELEDGLRYHYDTTISKLIVHTDTQCTGLIEINNNVDWYDSTTGTLKANKWIFNKIDDIVVNDYLPFIKGFIDLQNNNLNYNKDWFDISKFICIFAYVTMIYDNYWYDPIDNDWYTNDDEGTRQQANFVLNNVNVRAIKDNR